MGDYFSETAINENVRALFSENKLRNYLSVMSRFHTYSVNNMIMIAEQNPNATLVAGKGAWERKFGRTVNEGAKPIKILAPVKNGNTTGTQFQTVNVYDISQTSGRELSETLGSVNRTKLLETLEEISPVPLKKGDDIEANIKAAINDIAQSSVRGQNDADIKAQCIAFALCERFEVDTSDFSFSKLEEWSQNRDSSELKSLLEDVKSISNNLISDITPKIDVVKSEDVKSEERSQSMEDESVDIISQEEFKVKQEERANNNDDLFYKLDDLGDEHNNDSFAQVVALRNEIKRLELELAKAKKIVDKTNNILNSDSKLLSDFKAAKKKYENQQEKLETGKKLDTPKNKAR